MPKGIPPAANVPPSPRVRGHAEVDHPVRRRLLLALTLAMVAVLLPVETVVAEPVAPEVATETVDGLPEEARSLAEDAAGSVDAAAQSVADVVSRSEAIEAPIPFTSLGLKGTGPTPEVRVRTREADGDWSEWVDVEILDEFDGPDEGSPEERVAQSRDGEASWTTDAVWAGEATHLQVETVGGEVDDVEVTFIDAMGLTETRVEKISRGLRSLGTAPEAAEAAGRPRIISRSQWGANESWRSGRPSYARVKFAVVHHTATGTPRSRAESEAQMRSMYNWHTKGNGWSDLGYNFVVDPFGNVFEGRYGGVDKGVIGAHAGGWNTGSFGVSYIGNSNSAGFTKAGRQAMTDVIAWKFQLHGVNPAANATTSVNGARIRTIEGHRNLRGSYTRESSSSSFQQDCPGRNIYAKMGAIRKQVSNKASASTGVSTSPSQWTPVAGDWDGDGRETPGWFRDGRWKLTDEVGDGAEPGRGFYFGTSGDVPVVGDWNADGTDTIGVFRRGKWFLRDENASGAPAATFHYGRAGDIPVMGDWNGSTRDTVGVVRGNRWYLRDWAGSGSPQREFSFGRPGDLPVVGNWDGSLLGSRDGVGVRRGKRWYLRNSPGGGAADEAFAYGRATDVPAVADWDGPRRPRGLDALKSGVAAVRGETWHTQSEAAGGAAGTSFDFGH